MKLNVGYGTDVGQKRMQNQDSLSVHPELGLFVVADGMGGHRGGEIASAMSVEIVPRLVAESQQDPAWNPRIVISNAIGKASTAIYARSAEDPKLRGMGTTTLSALFKDDLLIVGHVGDSRCYYLQPDAIWQVTRDHSLVQEKLRAGLITREEVKTDKMKNVITRSVGFDYEIAVETYEMRVKPGDVFLLCSDGLSGMVEDQTILSIAQKNLFAAGGNLDQTAKELIASANAMGGDDNITTVLIQVAANA